jgi:hypothetical protein
VVGLDDHDSVSEPALDEGERKTTDDTRKINAPSDHQ